MNLYIIRHAIAVEAGDPKYAEDSQRPLTEKGADKMKKIAQGLLKLEVQLDLILSSPAVRTIATAEILAGKLNVKKSRLIATEHLALDGDAGQLIAEIKNRHIQVKNMALIGHEPNLSRLISLLVFGNEEGALKIKKGSVCLLTTDALEYGKCASLNWLLSPSQLVQIGKNS